MVLPQFFSLLVVGGTLLFLAGKESRHRMRLLYISLTLMVIWIVTSVLLYFQMGLSGELADDLLAVLLFSTVFVVEISLVRMLLAKVKKIASKYLYFILPFMALTTVFSFIFMTILVAVYPGS